MGSSRLKLESWWNAGLLSHPDRLTDVRSWHGHIPFAFWVIEAAEPRTVVELGTHKGDSFAALCQRVKEIGLDATCYAVDTWAGDEHSGLYGEDVFTEASEYFGYHFEGIAKLLRMYFAEALENFDDGSIDLLHIDGFHTYEAVSEDFAKWLPKMSSRGLVMLHDIAVRERGFGVWRFWDELARQYPNVAFSHSNGLGVIAVGETVPVA
nr:class I SAM-dependent methyltransferase [Actinomycetota bacterium]